MLHYIIQTIVFQLFFLIVYDAFLRRDTFFNWNRLYLLVTALLSVILPFVRIESFKTVMPQDLVNTLPPILLGESNNLTQNNLSTIESISETTTILSWQTILYVGIAITAILFVYKLIRLGVLIYKNPRRWKGRLMIVNLLNSNAAFSFFHYIFLGEKIHENQRDTILRHETIHVKQKHSLDLLFFEILRILFWFNPLVYMYQKRITDLHEFIADEKTIALEGKQQYYQNLLSQVFDTKNVSFTNSFYKPSLIKNRLVMINKTKTNRMLRLKYALLIPMIFGMLLYTSCEQEQDIIEAEQQQELSIVEQLKQMKLTLESKETLTEEEQRILKGIQLLDLESDLYETLNNNKSNKVITDKNTTYDYIEKEEVAFAVIDQVPLFPGCEGSSNEELKKCFSQQISKYVAKNFNTDLAKSLGLSGRQRISVIFKIDEKGNITGVKVRAPHETLEEESKRVIESLPQMQPGEHDGEKVTVQYSLPIIFQVAE